MSLLRLLTAGKCLMGLKDSVNRYRVNEQALLPKFGSTRDPFRKAAPTNKAASNPKPTAEKPAAVVVNTPGTPADRESARSGRRGFGGRMARGLKGLVRGRSKAPLASASPGGPVQPELALESVQVIRNDLSDSDIELVPARVPKPAPGPATSAPEVSVKPGAGWARRSLAFFRRADGAREAVKP